MSSSTTTASRQRTIGQSIVKKRIRKPPSGIIPRCQLHRERVYKYISNIADLGWVITPLSSASRVAEQHGHLESVLSVGQVPIVSGIAKDETTQSRDPGQVLDQLESIQPAVYIPDRGSVYQGKHNRARQLIGVKEYRGWLERLSSGVIERGLDVRLLPLAKGTSREHFEELRVTFEKLGFDEFAFYGGQNCGTAGNAIKALSDSLHTAIAVLEPEDVLLIGRHTPNDLSRFSSVVSAASVWGHNITDQWGSADAAHQWNETVQESEQSLKPDSTQTEITNYGTKN